MAQATSTIRLLTWNIQHGGGARRTPWIALALVEARADIIVLTEFRSVRGGQIRGALADHGLSHQMLSAAADGANAVLVASRWPLQACSAAGPGRQGRVIEAYAPEIDLRVIGAHIPPPVHGGAGAGAGERQVAWRAVLHAARAGRSGHVALLGDFNCGRAGLDGTSFRHTALLGQLATMGYVDAWRRLHPSSRAMTWHGPRGASGRIDLCFLSAALAEGLRACWIGECQMEVGAEKPVEGHFDGAARLSDHAPVVVELSPDVLKTGAPAVGKAGSGGQKPEKMGSIRPVFGQ